MYYVRIIILIAFILGPFILLYAKAYRRKKTMKADSETGSLLFTKKDPDYIKQIQDDPNLSRQEKKRLLLGYHYGASPNALNYPKQENYSAPITGIPNQKPITFDDLLTTQITLIRTQIQNTEQNIKDIKEVIKACDEGKAMIPRHVYEDMLTRAIMRKSELEIKLEELLPEPNPENQASQEIPTLELNLTQLKQELQRVQDTEYEDLNKRTRIAELNNEIKALTLKLNHLKYTKND